MTRAKSLGNPARFGGCVAAFRPDFRPAAEAGVIAASRIGSGNERAGAGFDERAGDVQGRRTFSVGPA